jgi:hypothetical protein
MKGLLPAGADFSVRDQLPEIKRAVLPGNALDALPPGLKSRLASSDKNALTFK